MKIVHISDIHLPTSIPIHSLSGKMILGYISYALRRKKKYPEEIFTAILEKVKSLDYDCLVISGDVANVSSETEFQKAFERLSPLMDERTFVIPGNHDRYVKRAVFPVDLFEKYFGKFTGDKSFEKENTYLRYKKIKNRLIVGWDSNFPNSLVKATGYVDKRIVSMTEELLKKIGGENPVIVCHHPLWNPENKHESSFHWLINRDEVIRGLKAISPIVYLHGHVHSNWIKLSDKEIPFDIVNSASSSRVSDHSHNSGFHVIDIQGKSASFSRFVYSEKDRKMIQGNPILYPNSLDDLHSKKIG